MFRQNKNEKKRMFIRLKEEKGKRKRIEKAKPFDADEIKGLAFNLQGFTE
jgi:hypothetical protein